jgi:SAM-dependent methyltransferase
VDLRPAAVAAVPDLAPVALSYETPFKLMGHLDNVLVVGCGMGNDVAAALRTGSKHVTAVEIDPAIIRLGKELHPEHPLIDPRTTTVLNDARAFFRKRAQDKSAKPFDLVVFGLLDSQTALSSMSSVRLEFFVYTVESMREALSLLDKEHGLAAVTFSVGWRDWIGTRMFRTIAEAAGADPLAITSTEYDGGVTFIAGPGLAKLDRARLAQLGVVDVTAKYAGSARPCTDDWPFLYVNPDHLPWVYLVALALLMAVGSRLVLRAMRRVAPLVAAERREGPRFDFHMFLMGAAFMLIETGAIARLSLVFGATWLVNAAVISAVLLMVLGSNAVVIMGRAPSVKACYVLLCASLAAVFFIPFDVFVFVRGGWAMASLLVAVPVLFSGLVFSKTFSAAPNAHVALGCNMLGALLGGALEAVSLVVGIRALALLALALYAVSAVVLNRQVRAAARAAFEPSRVPVEKNPSPAL